METTNLLSKNNLTMLTDFYEITMANGFFCTGNGEKKMQKGITLTCEELLELRQVLNELDEI